MAFFFDKMMKTMMKLQKKSSDRKLLFVVLIPLLVVSMIATISIHNHAHQALKGDSHHDISRITTSSSHSHSHKSSQCLTFDHEMDELVKTSKQIFIGTSAKGAGTTMKLFQNKCFGPLDVDLTSVSSISSTSTSKGGTIPDSNKIFQNPELMTGKESSSYMIPPFFAGHVREKALLHLVKGISNKTLLIYIYREETERVSSAIQFVINARMCESESNGNFDGMEEFKDKMMYMDMDTNTNMYNKDHKDNKNSKIKKCIIEEDALIDIIKQKKHEISGPSIPDTLTCSLYDAIEENKPSMVFIHYKQVDKLVDLLGKYHCPEMLAKLKSTLVTTHINHQHEHTESMVKLSKKVEGTGGSDQFQPISEWVGEKKHTLEWRFGLKENMTCQGKTKDLERDLFSCPDEIIRIA